MKHIAIFLLTLSPAVAYAQVLEELTMQLRDSDGIWRMQGGLAACLGGFESPSTPEQTANAFEHMEWQNAGSYGGLTEYAYKDSSALVAQNGTFCEIADMGVPQTEAADLVRRTFAEMSEPLWTQSTSAAGCTTFTSPSGRVIEISSGGQDPICGDTPTSAIRVLNEASKG
ncbi:hypothetical protein [Roseovarius sp. E0-M6]|uniref:hypothetical protein n=1 Tax=Roseovarius sp. E0-M6 TaxID=3127118 RepID=UPI00300FDEDA